MMSKKANPSRDMRSDLPRIGVDYSKIESEVIVDARFERERKPYSTSSNAAAPSATSSTYDAFIRMQAGIEGRTLANRLADTNRPTWETYKKENEERLDHTGADSKKMIEYRQQLDAERDARLKDRKRSNTKKEDSDSASSDSDASRSDKRSKKSKKEKKKKKKHKSSKKSKRESDDDDADSPDEYYNLNE